MIACDTCVNPDTCINALRCLRKAFPMLQSQAVVQTPLRMPGSDVVNENSSVKDEDFGELSDDYGEINESECNK